MRSNAEDKAVPPYVTSILNELNSHSEDPKIPLETDLTSVFKWQNTNSLKVR